MPPIPSPGPRSSRPAPFASRSCQSGPRWAANERSVVDLHLMSAAPTEDERDAVDRLLGPAENAWEGGERSDLDGHVARGGHEARGRRHLLLPALHALQSRVGWISQGGLSYVCRRL